MCNCIELAEQKFKELFEQKMKAQNIEVVRIKEEGFTNLPFWSEAGVRFFNPYEIKYVIKKVNGEPEQKTRTYKNNLIASYCPMCGEQYSKQ